MCVCVCVCMRVFMIVYLCVRVCIYDRGVRVCVSMCAHVHERVPVGA